MVWRALLRTNPSGISATILRFTMAGVLFPHGVIKLFGDVRNVKFMAGLEGLVSHVGFPISLAVTVIAIEFLGPIMLLLGIAYCSSSSSLSDRSIDGNCCYKTFLFFYDLV